MTLWIRILGINSFIAIVYLTDICSGQLFFDPSNLSPPRIIFTTMAQKRRSYIVKCCGSDSCIPRDTRTRGNETDEEYEEEEGGEEGAAKATAAAGGGATTAAAEGGGGGETTAAAGGDTPAAGGDTPAAGGDTTAAAAEGETTAAAAADGETTAAAGGETAAAGGETAAAAAAEGDTTTAPVEGETSAAAEPPAALVMAPESDLAKPEFKVAQRSAQRRNKVTQYKKRSKVEAKNKPVDLKSQLKGAAGIRTGRTHKGTQNKNKGKPQVSMVGNKIRVNLGGQKKNKENKQGKNEKLLQFGLKN